MGKVKQAVAAAAINQNIMGIRPVSIRDAKLGMILHVTYLLGLGGTPLVDGTVYMDMDGQQKIYAANEWSIFSFNINPECI